jgi:AICAR transformylase/IMP cyclohydrolase PurH
LEDLNVPFKDVKKMIRKKELFQKKIEFFHPAIEKYFLKDRSEEKKMPGFKNTLQWFIDYFACHEINFCNRGHRVFFNFIVSGR